MKAKRFSALVLAVILLLGATGAAAAGSASDPLISLSYITGTYFNNFLQAAQSAVDNAFASSADGSEWIMRYIGAGSNYAAKYFY